MRKLGIFLITICVLPSLSFSTGSLTATLEDSDECDDDVPEVSEPEYTYGTGYYDGEEDTSGEESNIYTDESDDTDQACDEEAEQDETDDSQTKTDSDENEDECDQEESGEDSTDDDESSSYTQTSSDKSDTCDSDSEDQEQSSDDDECEPGEVSENCPCEDWDSQDLSEESKAECYDQCGSDDDCLQMCYDMMIYVEHSVGGMESTLDNYTSGMHNLTKMAASSYSSKVEDVLSDKYEEVESVSSSLQSAEENYDYDDYDSTYSLTDKSSSDDDESYQVTVEGNVEGHVCVDADCTCDEDETLIQTHGQIKQPSVKSFLTKEKIIGNNR